MVERATKPWTAWYDSRSFSCAARYSFTTTVVSVRPRPALMVLHTRSASSLSSVISAVLPLPALIAADGSYFCSAASAFLQSANTFLMITQLFFGMSRRASIEDATESHSGSPSSSFAFSSGEPKITSK